MNWSNWILLSTNKPITNTADTTTRQLIEVETRDGQRFLLAELNHRGGACDCCTTANWYSSNSNNDVIKYRTTIIPVSD